MSPLPGEEFSRSPVGDVSFSRVDDYISTEAKDFRVLTNYIDQKSNRFIELTIRDTVRLDLSSTALLDTAGSAGAPCAGGYSVLRYGASG